jgi:hypothetical protein
MKALLIFLFPASAFAAITLQTQLELPDGKKVSPLVTVNSGDTATVGQDDVEIRLTATDDEARYVTISAILYRRQERLGQASLRARCGQKSEIRVDEENGDLRYRFSATPKCGDAK